MKQNQCLWLHGSGFNALKGRMETDALSQKIGFES